MALVAVLVLLRRAYVRSGGKPERWVILSAAASMTAAVVHGSVDNFYFLPELAGLFWATAAFAVISSGESAKEPRASPPQ